MHVALVGMMGAGKTTVGRRLAKLLGRPFVDGDEAFVPRYGRSVAETVATSGEAAFREDEARLLAELLAVPEPLVVACGGGAVVTASNRRLLGDPGVVVVYLRADPTFLARRASAKADRFLLAGRDPLEVMTELLAEREPWYEELADEVIDVSSFHEWGSQPKRAIAERIAAVVADRESAG